MSLFKNETTLPILITIACTLLMAGMLLYGYNTGKFPWLSDKTQEQSLVQEEKKEEEKITRTDYTEVARKTLDWIDKQRNEDGWYILGKTCGPKDCEQVMDDTEVGNKDGLIATWARLNFYDQHKESKDLEIVKKDIDLFYEKYKDKDLSDSLWLCKIGYEMAQSKYIDQGQKDKLKELCFSLKEVGVGEIDKSWTEHLRQMDGGTYSPMTWKYYSLYLKYYDNYFGQISDLAYKYAWSGEEKYKELIEKHFFVEEDLILNNKNIEPQSLCLFGLSILDEWNLVNKSDISLNYVINFYKIIQTKNEKENFLVNPICGLLAKRLLNVTREGVYLDDFESISKALLLNNQREERGTNKEGFVRSDLSKGGFQPHRIVVENSLIVEFLR